MEDRNGGAIIAIGGVITVVVLAMWAMRFIHKLFLQIAKTADAFAAMVSSVAGSLWALAQIAFLVSLAVGCVVAAVYFTYKYILMVKRGTELQATVARQLDELQYSVSKQLQSFQSEVENRVEAMHRVLNEALKEPDLVPVQVVATQPTVELLPPGPDAATSESDPSNQGDPDAAMSAVSNPF
jgi:hypothetical protein